MDSRSHDLLETPAFPEAPFSIFLKTPDLLEQSYPKRTLCDDRNVFHLWHPK